MATKKAKSKEPVSKKQKEEYLKFMDALVKAWDGNKHVELIPPLGDGSFWFMKIAYKMGLEHIPLEVHGLLDQAYEMGKREVSGKVRDAIKGYK